MIRYTGCLIAICALSLLITSLASAEGQEKPTEPAVATVNGEKIPRSALDKEMQMATARNPELRDKENLVALRQARKEALDYLISQELIIQEGRKANLIPKDTEIDVEVARIKKRFPTEDAFTQILKQQGLTMEALRGLIERGLIAKKVITEKVKPMAKPVADEDVANYYAAHKEEFVEPEKVSARHILLKISPDDSDEKKLKAKEKLQGILKEARNGADFAELAKKYSEGPSAPRVGDLGYFTRGQMVKPFEDAAFSLEPDQISDIVETQFGYHIILVEDKKSEGQIAFESIKEEIKKALEAKESDIALKGWLEPIREKADIKITGL
jgi:peptidyl-prolyl cis-trans isomerase C